MFTPIEKKARQELEERARKEKEEKERIEAEERARIEAEELARIEEEDRIQAEAEEKARLEAEEKARLEAEEQARRAEQEKKALALFQQAAEKGHAKAQRSLTELVLAGNADAQFILGKMRAEGIGFKQDDESAVSWFLMAIEKGHEPAQQYLFKMAGAGNNAEAQFALGKLRAEGKGVEQDDKKAFHWLQLAAEQGHEPAKRYLRGMAVSGNAEAQFTLGRMFAEGIGVCQSDKVAFQWIRDALAQGHMGAQCYLEKMADEGNLEAQFMLGKALMDALVMPEDEGKTATASAFGLADAIAVAKQKARKMNKKPAETAGKTAGKPEQATGTAKTDEQPAQPDGAAKPAEQPVAAPVSDIPQTEKA